MAKFRLFIWGRNKSKILVTAAKAVQCDLEVTRSVPQWQTDWTSSYITKRAVKPLPFRHGDIRHTSFPR